MMKKQKLSLLIVMIFVAIAACSKSDSSGASSRNGGSGGGSGGGGGQGGGNFEQRLFDMKFTDAEFKALKHDPNQCPSVPNELIGYNRYIHPSGNSGFYTFVFKQFDGMSFSIQVTSLWQANGKELEDNNKNKYVGKCFGGVAYFQKFFNGYQARARFRKIDKDLEIAYANEQGVIETKERDRIWRYFPVP